MTESNITDSLKMPDAEANGFIKTFNNMGYMTSTLDEVSKEFIKFSPNAPGPVLDIGAAYGIAAIPALEAGATLIANDIDPRHLEVLKERTPKNFHDRLTLVPGSFPDDLSFEDGSLGAILVCRVLHFFDGAQIERAARVLFSWLKADGKVFIVAETPYLKNFQSYIPIYEAKKKAGDPWPGFIADVMAIAPERGASLPAKMHLLDPDVLSRTFKEAGFVIEQAKTLARTDFPIDLQLDGRESVGLVARKP